MTNFLNSLIENNNIPFVTAVLLGIIIATHPCVIATNITAVGFLSKDIQNSRKAFRNGLYYTLGRTITYSVIGVCLIILLRTGANAFSIEKFFSRQGQYLLPPILILFGCIVLWGHKIKIRPAEINSEKTEKLKDRGGWGAFLLGLLLALAFCPTSAFLYFGMLIPMSVPATGGFFLPIIFAIVSAIPVIIIAWLIAFSLQKISKFYNNVKKIEKYFRIIVGVLFLAIGIFQLISVLI